jgi:hypothetical protein
VFLNVGQFPPNPVRGFDLFAAIVRVDLVGCGEGSAKKSRAVSNATLLFPAAPMLQDRRRELSLHFPFQRPEQGTQGESIDHTFLVYTSDVLVQMPIPDFSMPFNVITLNSTVIAFFMGTMMNVMVRKVCVLL